MTNFREIILDLEPAPQCIDWEMVFDVLLIAAWFAAAAWVLMS